MVARFRKEKDHGGLLEAFFRFLQTGRRARLVLVGDGPLEDLMRKKARKLHIDKQVHFLGRIPLSKVPSLLKALDVFVYPTFREGMPMAVMEAMAAGLPIIATEAEGLSDLFDSSLTFGKLLPPGNPELLAQALVELYDLGEEKRAQLGEAARRRILEAFSPEVLSQRTIEIVTHLMKT
nr:glycosyltransferase [Thermosulfurimonas marina]